MPKTYIYIFTSTLNDVTMCNKFAGGGHSCLTFLKSFPSSDARCATSDDFISGSSDEMNSATKPQRSTSKSFLSLATLTL